MDNTSLFFVGVMILFMILMVIVFKVSRTKDIEIHSADDKVVILTRKWNDAWNDNKDFMAFHDENGELCWVAKHWIIKMKEIAKDGNGKS